MKSTVLVYGLDMQASGHAFCVDATNEDKKIVIDDIIKTIENTGIVSFYAVSLYTDEILRNYFFDIIKNDDFIINIKQAATIIKQYVSTSSICRSYSFIPNITIYNNPYNMVAGILDEQLYI